VALAREPSGQRSLTVIPGDKYLTRAGGAAERDAPAPRLNAPRTAPPASRS
jgi:hypothetical protein